MRTILQGESLEFDKPSMVLACCGCGMKHTVQLDEDDGRPILRYFLWDVKDVSSRDATPDTSVLIEAAKEKLDQQMKSLETEES